MRDPWITELEWLTRGVRAVRIAREIRRQEMSRLTEKLAQAGGVVARQSAKIEARADAIIARESALEALTDNAFSGHEAILSETEKGLDGLERQLALVTNGAPLEPSSDSPASPPLLHASAQGTVTQQTAAATGDQRSFDRLG